MSEKLYFTPYFGYKLTQLGVLPAYDSWNNKWQGEYVSCAHHDPRHGTVRGEPQMMSMREKMTIMSVMHPVLNPGAILDIPKNTIDFVTRGVHDLGGLESPLKTICDARRKAEDEQRSR